MMSSAIMEKLSISPSRPLKAVGDSSDSGHLSARALPSMIQDDSCESPKASLCESSASSSAKVTHGFGMPAAAPRAAPSTTKADSSNSPFDNTTNTKALNDVSSSSLGTAAAGRSKSTNHPTNALDALLTLASNAHHRLAGTADDSLSMPPPPNRRVKRVRSASNPEGMEKWDSYSVRSNRMHFVLPSSILEEELASATNACEAYEKKRSSGLDTFQFQRPVRKTVMTDFSIHSQPQVDCEGIYGTSPTTVVSSLSLDAMAKNGSRAKSKGTAKKQTSSKKKSSAKSNAGKASPSSEEDGNSSSGDTDNENVLEEKEIDESDLEPEELLKRARSRLFEDLSAENGLEKGTMAMPHSLDKYKEIYNKNGRIGIYTPAERAAIIAKFNSKRTRRTWKKKIRYNCRKSLADRRMRVKGRFVKRAVEQNTTKVEPENKPAKESSVMSDSSPGLESEDNGSDSSRTSSPIPMAPPSGPLAPVIEDTDLDADGDVDMGMPDVKDPDAGFKPTASQPFRRVRRHTIT